MEKTSNSGVKLGDRVGCFLSVVEKSAIFLGWGTYMGDEVPPNEGHSSLTAYLSGERRANPKIILDSGDIVWGCECWWGPEEEVKTEYAKMDKVVDITIAEARSGRIPEGFEEHRGGEKSDDSFGDGGSEPSSGTDFWS